MFESPSFAARLALPVVALFALCQTSHAATGAQICGGAKLKAVAGYAKELGSCYGRYAKTADADAHAACLEAAALTLDIELAAAEAKSAARDYTCWGSAAEMGLTAADSVLAELADELLLADAVVPDACLAKRSKALGKFLSGWFDCDRKNLRKPDRIRRDQCRFKASPKFAKLWSKASAKGLCTANTQNRAQADAARRARAIYDVLAFGPEFLDEVGPGQGVDGAFLLEGPRSLAGRVRGLADVTSVRVDGVEVAFSGDEHEFTAEVDFDAAAIFEPVLVEVTDSTGELRRRRYTVVAIDDVNTSLVAEGEMAPSSLALRIAQTGLQQLEPVVAGLAGGALDIGSLIGGDGLSFSGGEATIDEVGFSGFGLGLDPTAAGVVEVNVTINDFFVSLAVDFSGIQCGLELIADNVFINGAYDLEPQAADAAKVDVNQIGSPAVSFSDFQYEFTSGICNDPILGGLVELFVPDIETLVADGFASSLADPDGAGPQDSAIAGGIEQALAAVSIAGPIGAAIGVDLEAPFRDITIDDEGISFDVDSAITTLAPDPLAPPLPGSLALSDLPMPFGALTPVGSLPYGMALGLSSTAFNQLLASQIASGLLRSSITEFELVPGNGPEPIKVSLLRLLLPSISTALAQEFVEISIAPTLAPVMTGQAGPGGELIEMQVAGLRVVLDLPGRDFPLLDMVVDMPLGVDLVFGEAGIGFELGFPAAEALSLTLLANNSGAPDADVLALVPTLLPLALPSLADAFAGLPLPAFFGLELSPVELARVATFLGVYIDLGLGAQADYITNVSLTDLSSADVKVDVAAQDVHQWRHRTTLVSDADSASASLKGVIGADACCTGDDESLAASVHWQLNFDVVSDEDWEVFVSHDILGAISIIDEKVALEDAGGSASISPVSATWQVDGGAIHDFSFTPAPSSVVHALNGGEGTTDAEFSGAGLALISGTGNASVVLDFAFDLSVTSDSNLFFPAAGGDEVAIRFGRNDTLQDNFTAGQYPKGDNATLGARDIDDDGHFVSIVFGVTP